MGFRSPLIVLGLSAVVAASQGGFRSPIPPLSIGGNSSPPIVQGGFRSPIPVLSIGSNGIAALKPIVVIKDGGGGAKTKTVNAEMLSLIQREDEELIEIVTVLSRIIL